MIYRELEAPARFTSAPRGYVAMQSDIQVCEEDGEKYAVAIFPSENSATWYFLTPSREVWVNGLDDKTTARDCITIINTYDLALSELTETLARWPTSNLGGIFKTVLDKDGGLLLRLIEKVVKSKSINESQ